MGRPASRCGGAGECCGALARPAEAWTEALCIFVGGSFKGVFLGVESIKCFPFRNWRSRYIGLFTVYSLSPLLSLDVADATTADHVVAADLLLDLWSAL